MFQLMKKDGSIEDCNAVDYDYVVNYLDDNYDRVKNDKIIMYMNNDGNPVAFIKNDIISMRFDNIMVGIIKNIPLIDNYKGFICDAAIVTTSAGPASYFERSNELFVYRRFGLDDNIEERRNELFFYNNIDIEKNIKELSSIGNYEGDLYDESTFNIGNNLYLTFAELKESHAPDQIYYGIIKEKEEYKVSEDDFYDYCDYYEDDCGDPIYDDYDNVYGDEDITLSGKNYHGLTNAYLYTKNRQINDFSNNNYEISIAKTRNKR